MSTRHAVGAMALSLSLMLQAIPAASPAPTVEITAPVPGDVTHESNVTVFGNAFGSDFWCNHTDVSDLSGNLTCAVKVSGPEGGLTLPRWLYDDFDDGSFNTTAWSRTTCDATVSEKGGVLVANATATSKGWKTHAILSTTATGYTDFSADIKIHNYSGEHSAYVEMYQDSTHWARIGYHYDSNTSKEGWYHAHMDGSGSGWGWSGGDLTDFHNFRLIYDNATSVVYYYGDNAFQNYDEVTLTNFECRLVACAGDQNDSIEAHFDNVSVGYCSGYYVSDPIDTKMPNPEIWNVNWTATTSGSSTASVALRSCGSPDMAAPTAWRSVGNHGNCSMLAFMRYVQYKVMLKAPAPGASLLFRSISIQIYTPVEKVEVGLDGVEWALANGTYWWSRTMTLPDGNRTIHCRATDALGKTARSSVKIIVDTIPPVASLGINDGGAYAGWAEVNLTIDWSGPVEVTRMQLSNTPAFTDDGWVPYERQTRWNLTGGDGEKRVYCMLCDRFGLSSAKVRADVTLDTAPPAARIAIMGGGPMTTEAQVRLALEATDNYGVEAMQLSNLPGFEGAEWTPFSPAVLWNLTAGPGNKTMFLRVQDRAGHLSPAASASILRVAEGGSGPPPAAAMTVNDGSGFATDRSVTVNISVGGGEAAWMMLGSDGTFTGCWWGPFKRSVPWKLSEPDGKKGLHGRFATGDGRLFTAVTEVVLDTVPPEGTVYVNGGERDTLSPDVRLDLGARDDNGVAMMMVSNTPDFSAAVWEPYCEMKNWTLAGGDGVRTVHVRFRDPAGLVSEPALASILVDTGRPVPAGTVTINSGRAYTNSVSASLSLRLDNSSLNRQASMMISNFEDFRGATWERFRTTRDWELPPGDGEKTVYVVFEADRMRSAPVSDAIVLDTVAPGPPVLDTYPRTTTESSVRLGGKAEPSSNLTIAGIPVPVGPDGRFSAEIPLLEGEHILKLVMTDPAGNTNSSQITIMRNEKTAPPATAVPSWAAAVIGAVAVAMLGLVAWRVRSRKPRPSPKAGGKGRSP